MISDPNLAILLMSLGALGILVEFCFPGKVVPGVAGGVALLVGLASLVHNAGRPISPRTASVAIPTIAIGLMTLRIGIRAWRNKRSL